ncbi:MAG: hypothetical protein JJ863_26155 [Deltaproteobacteria bacterium]|nr:hypothetical protein [Deltaproteobacteria bacterium]
MTRTVIAVALLVTAGCENDVAQTTSRRERSSSPTTLELAGIEAEVPAGYERLAGEDRDRLAMAASRRDPAAEVEVEGAHPPGTRLGLVLTHIVHDASYGAGYPVAESAADAEQLARIGAESRGIGVETSSECGERSCDVVFTLRGPDLTTTTRSRMWRRGGRLVEVGCQCVTTPELDACALRCELPDAPADATVE